ncbi:MAG: hypothetical protein MUE50_12365 [Pirellulaceae bacterium]|nr:hypothetical protein [Pirellulaceae bacterium]
MRLCACIWILLLAVAPGCATHVDRVRQGRDLYFRGQAEQAALELEKFLPRAGKERDVAELDWAMAQLFSGRPAEAEQTLREVRDRFDYLEQKDLAEAALSYLTDDNQRAYAGEDYEKVLIRVTLALANLMGEGGDAEAYSLQVNAKQQEIIESGTQLDEANPKVAYPRVAVGAYLHGVLREATHGNYDDAERAFATVVSWQPDFPAGGFDLQRVREGRHSAPGNGVLYLFAFVGRGPYKREVSEIPTSQAMLIADRIISAVGKHSVPPTLAPIKVPQLVTSENRLDRILVNVDGQPVGATETVTDVGQLAVQQYQAIYPHILARAVARRAVKKAAVYAVKEQVDGLNVWASLAMDAAGVVWEATESADTRCWTLLPDKIQVLRVELPAGQHRVALRPAQGRIPLGGPRELAVAIEDGRNCYALVCCPDADFAGQTLVSGR